jgi:Na+-transporting methylmalonyl-CoA/oxaloacetate decarboxylase gamma subunit
MAVVLMILILLTGTYAWQSISQLAINNAKDPQAAGRTSA